jgi:hypothetical protein
MTQSPRSYTVLQAAQATPTLARLTELTRESSARLKSIEPLVPAALRNSLTAGPIDGAVWCLIVDNNATAAKIRQLLPAFMSHLRSKGWEVTSIRLRIQMQQTRKTSP